MLCGRLILRTHKQQNPSRRSEGFSFVGPDTAKSTDAVCSMSLLFLQLGHGALVYASCLRNSRRNRVLGSPSIDFSPRV